MHDAIEHFRGVRGGGWDVGMPVLGMAIQVVVIAAWASAPEREEVLWVEFKFGVILDGHDVVDLELAGVAAC